MLFIGMLSYRFTENLTEVIDDLNKMCIDVTKECLKLDITRGRFK